MAEKPSSKGKQEETTETESPSPAPQPEQQEKAPEKPPAYVPPATREKRQRSVVHYIAILFAAAFLLMLMAYLMDQRQNQAMNDLNQSLTGLQDSITDQSSLQDIYEDNMQLIQQVGQLEEQVKQLEEDKQSGQSGNGLVLADRRGLRPGAVLPVPGADPGDPGRGAGGLSPQGEHHRQRAVFALRAVSGDLRGAVLIFCAGSFAACGRRPTLPMAAK